ncbi:MAG TPA: ribosome biogenesis factor YjgA [Xanthomonadaceae bacterium]|nr:ribosome biogenesis factor YjgA [Xanthomonadaceae bacterium]
MSEIDDEAISPDDSGVSNGWAGPSRSHLRREALAVFELAERLIEQNDAQLARLPLDDQLRALVRESKRITQQIARKRQTQYLAKILRREDDETLEAVRHALDHAKADSRRDTAALHRIEVWRERLIDNGDIALAELLTAHPTADRQHLRQLARNAKDERLHHKPLHAYRDLFRALRELLDEAPETGDAASETDEG